MRRLFETYQRKLGKVGGEKFSVLRPDYEDTDQEGDTVIISRSFRAAPQGNKFAEPSASGITMYSVFGSRTGIQCGDILVPTESGSGTPVITVSTIAPLKALSGFVTEQAGKITEDVGTDVYTSIRFTWLPIVFPGSDLTEHMSGSLGISTRRLVMYKREGLKRGMRIIDESGNDDQRWLLKDFVTLNNLMVCNLTLDDR